MSVYDILACPTCKVRVERHPDLLLCTSCGQQYPIIEGVPVMFPDGSVPEIVHEAELDTRDSYNPWIHRTILQSLADDQIVLEIGSGTMTLDDPCIIRLDVTLTPHVDVVADVHALPFLPGTIHFVFSLAVFEHLRNPFDAARSIREVLVDGGYVYHECNFVFGYHGYPHHYFNASRDGMRQIFSEFVPLRTGVAPYQMPSFALEMILHSYLERSRADEFGHGRRVTAAIRNLLRVGLTDFDIYFSEDDAAAIAAGTFFAGQKRDTRESTLIPGALRDIWASDDELRARFPDVDDLTAPDNIMWWARAEGRRTHPAVYVWGESIEPWTKWEGDRIWQRKAIRTLPMLDTPFGAVGYAGSDTPLEERVRAAEARTMAEGSRLERGRALAESGLATIRSQGVREGANDIARWIRGRGTR